jgi:sulfopyruvate decarboxylase TPP-binding subunit
VRIVEPILDAMGIAYHEIETDADVPAIKPAIDEAYAQSKPVVILIGRRLPA